MSDIAIMTNSLGAAVRIKPASCLLIYWKNGWQLREKRTSRMPLIGHVDSAA